MKFINTRLSILASALILAACQQGTPSNNNASAPATAQSASNTAAAPKGLETNTQQMSYIMGENMGKQLAAAKNEEGFVVDMKVLTEAIQEQLDGKPTRMTPEQKQAAIEEFGKQMAEKAAKKIEEDKAKAAENLKAGDKFLADNKAKDGVKTTNSGLQYKINKEGTGDVAKLGDGVYVEYTGKLIDGTEFDSTAKHGGEPFAVPLTGESVIKGWTEGLQLMKEGGEYTLYIPAGLAYGEQSLPNIPINSVLIFDMKIVKIEKDAVKEELARIKESKKPNLDSMPIVKGKISK